MEDMCYDRGWTPSVSLYLLAGERQQSCPSSHHWWKVGFNPNLSLMPDITLYLECLVGVDLVRVHKGGDVPDKFCTAPAGES